MCWMKKFNFAIGNIRLDENNQSERKPVKFLIYSRKTPQKRHRKQYPNKQIKLGHYPVKQKATLLLQEEVGME